MGSSADETAPRSRRDTESGPNSVLMKRFEFIHGSNCPQQPAPCPAARSIATSVMDGASGTLQTPKEFLAMAADANQWRCCRSCTFRL